MKKTLGVTLLLICAGLALAVSVARPAAKETTLDAVVGPGFSITLMQNGVRVTNLDPGDYTINVDDKSSEHDFHLFGPGNVDQTTTVDGIGTATWHVTFVNGSYSYVCDAHVATMVGHFTVGGGAPTTTTTPAPAPLTVHATAKAVGRTITIRASASRSATYDITLWRGTAKVAHAAKATLRYVAKKPGRYVAKIVAKSGSSTARASASVAVK